MNEHDATELAYKRGEWDMFELNTSVYFGKQYYFLKDDGRVYSRESHQYMTREEAFQEFHRMIECDDCEPEAKSGHWITKNGITFCSECMTCGLPFWKRCPVCEAKMGWIEYGTSET